MDSIERYLLEQLVNLNNKDSQDSQKINTKIEGLRNRLKTRYSWNGEIVFFPNFYYAKRTIFENHRDKAMFTNKINVHTMEGLDFKEIQSLDQMNTKIESFIYWMGETIGTKPKNSFLFRHLDWNETDPGESDAFVTSPMCGISILGFRGKLTPYYLGSNSIEHLDRTSFFLKENDPKAFECGTGNYPIFLFLIDFLCL